MTYVAQPFERFAEDLLSALTGTITREEHLFRGRDQTYTPALPGLRVDSLQVYGQSNERFTLFNPGLDYRFDPGTESIAWLSQGRVPDDHTYFYINYYPQEAAPLLTDRNPGSVTSILARSFGREFAVVSQQMEIIYRSGYVDTAEAASLDHVAALLGLDRRDARFASGEVLFKRSTPASGDIAIPAGTQVSTPEGQTFETSDRRTLRRGQLAMTVPVRAQVEGPAGKVEPGKITLVNRPIFGIETVTNERATFFAAQKETDDEFRRRIRAALERAGRSTPDAIRYNLIEKIPQVSEENLQLVERGDVPGLVEVRLGLQGGVDPDLVRQVEQAIFDARPAGVRVTHNLPSASQALAQSGTGAGRAQALADFTSAAAPLAARELDASILSGMPEGLLPLQIEVLLNLNEPNLSPAQKEHIFDQVRNAVLDYVARLPMGAPLVYAKLLGRVVDWDEVADAALLIGPANSPGRFMENLSSSGRKAAADAAHVFVGLMEESVALDVLATLEAKPGGNGLTGQLSLQLKENLQAVALQTIQAGQVRGQANDLQKAALEQALRQQLAATPFQLADGGLVLNAEYEETGRLLNHTDQIALADYEALRLRKMDVRLAGVLDV